MPSEAIRIKRNRGPRIDCDRSMYRWRHAIDNWVAKPKEFRAIATRYDETDESVRANITPAVAIVEAR